MRPTLDVADIFRRHGPAYVQAHDGHLGRVEHRVMSAIELCRTSAFGGHVEGCRAVRFMSPIIPAATGTARSARVRSRATGWRHVRTICYRFPISTWYSHCPPRSRR